MRVSFEDGAVHECAGIAFVGIADDELFTFRLIGGELPLPAGREAAAAASAQARGDDGFDHLLRLHLRQRGRECGIAALGNVLFDFLGVDPAGVAQHDAGLKFVRGGAFRLRIIPGAFERAGSRRGRPGSGRQDGRNLLRCHIPVDQPLAAVAVDEHDDRLGEAETHAADFADFNRIFEAAFGDFVPDRLQDGLGSGGDAAGSERDKQFHRRARPGFEFSGDFRQLRGIFNFHDRLSHVP